MSFLRNIFSVGLLVVFLGSFDPVSAQRLGADDIQEAVFLEILGYSSGFSVNYERSNREGHAVRFGVGFPLLESAMIDDNFRDCESIEIFFLNNDGNRTEGICTPVLHMGYAFSQPFLIQNNRRWAYEFGAGPSFYLVDADLRGFLSFNFGIRIDGKNFGVLRAGFTPSIGQGLIISQFGVSVGFRIRSN
ncbi:hypothetical protein CYPRO_2183 [Cyclonatronum proteinivorum]|uniref:Uncharacterized protein n=1 Tax=Cyclonatronum proteinivorum TaxID=1457365 RepID=A0A345ULS9_9BACT|nr:hypothetical protein [Cyclonatronum proteinivorum]AXJ01431.1 hypothetical protein CYPRO_2183 [Cyclonatronum proteinivorum]